MLPFTGNPLDRRSDKRSDIGWVAEQLRRARVLPLWQTQVLVTGAPGLKAASIPAGLIGTLAVPGAPLVFLGLDVETPVFALDVSDNLALLDADRDKLEDVLTNLISNAIRFSPDGSKIRISSHVVVGDMLEILVEDSGPGIPAQDLANLFEPFYTGMDLLHHTSGTIEFNTRGIGLGLAIVRRFVELHGGIIRVKTLTHEGHTAGTQFQILLPLVKAEPPANPAQRSDPSAAGTS